MTADEWMEQRGKSPFSTGEFTGWYWGEDFGGLPDYDTLSDDDMLLPSAIYARMSEKPSYPYCRRYLTFDEAIADFRLGFDRAVQEGWNPEES